LMCLTIAHQYHGSHGWEWQSQSLGVFDNAVSKLDMQRIIIFAAPPPAPPIPWMEVANAGLPSHDWQPPLQGIPPLLHQSWRSRRVPSNLAAHMHTWRRHMPSWRFRLHTDEDNDVLVKEQFPWLLKAWYVMTSIQRADIARLLYMHSFGGVYADLDVELLQPLEPLLNASRDQNASALLGQEPMAHTLLLERKPRQICNAVLASVAGHPFWLWVVQLATNALLSSNDNDPVGTTGPRMLERAVRVWQAKFGQTGMRLQVSTPDTFYPLWDSGQENTFRERCERPYHDAAPVWANESDIMAQGLDHAVIETCARLQREEFRPTIPADGSSFAAHHWAHTWMDDMFGGVSEQSEVLIEDVRWTEDDH